jgi:hypothetical protein
MEVKSIAEVKSQFMHRVPGTSRDPLYRIAMGSEPTSTG